MDTDVWILGGYQSDFARNFTKEGLDFADLTREVVDAGLAAAKVDAADIASTGVIHVANAFGELFAEQGHLGAMPATVCDGLWDTPASRQKPPARPAVWRPWRRWPTCDRATTRPRWSSASNWRRPCPAT